MSFLRLFCLIITFLLSQQLFAQVNTERLRNRDAKPGFAGKAGLSFTYLSGNTEFFKISSQLRLDYSKQNFYSFAVANYQRGIRKESDFINKGFLHWRFMYDLSATWTGETFVQRAFNEFTDLRSRNLIGGGARFNLRFLNRSEEKERSLDAALGIGLMWEEETIESSGLIKQRLRSTNYVAVYGKFDPKMQFSTVTYFQTALQNPSDSRILSQFILRLGFLVNVDYRAVFGLNYDTRPPENVKKHDFELLNGLEYRW